MIPHDPEKPIDAIVLSATTAKEIDLLIGDGTRRIRDMASNMDMFLEILRAGLGSVTANDEISMTRLEMAGQRCHIFRTHTVLTVDVATLDATPHTIFEMLFQLDRRVSDEDLPRELQACIATLRQACDLFDAHALPKPRIDGSGEATIAFGSDLLPWRILSWHIARSEGYESSSLRSPIREPKACDDAGTPLPISPRMRTLLDHAPIALSIAIVEDQHPSLTICPVIYDHVADLTDHGVDILDAMRTLAEARDRGFIEQ